MSRLRRISDANDGVSHSKRRKRTGNSDVCPHRIRCYHGLPTFVVVTTILFGPLSICLWYKAMMKGYNDYYYTKSTNQQEPTIRLSAPRINALPANAKTRSSVIQPYNNENNPTTNQGRLELLTSQLHKLFKTSPVTKDRIYKIEDISPCRDEDDYSYLDRSVCSGDVASKKVLVYYNSIGIERWVCGHVVHPYSFTVLPGYCNIPSRMFPRDPASVTELKERMHKPIIVDEDKDADLNYLDVTTPVYLRYGYMPSLYPPESSTRLPLRCDVHCRTANSPSGVTYFVFVDQTPFLFMSSMEGEGYFTRLGIDSSVWKTYQYYSTTSFKSEVPMAYYRMGYHDLKKVPAVKFNDTENRAVFLAANCNSLNNREVLVRGLQEAGVAVDSLGSCMNNAVLPAHIDLQNKTAVMRRYKLYLAFENQNVDDYITEKLWGALEAGVLPVYLGAPNIAQRVPHPRSYIDVNNFQTIEALARHLNRTMQDEDLFNSYFEWRDEQEERPEFIDAYNFTTVHSTCRLCRFGYAKRHGLGWYHQNQEIVELQLKRDLVTDDTTGLVTKPFAERYRTDRIEQTTTESSTHNTLLRAVQIDKRVVREVYQHDGVIDIHYTAVKNNNNSASPGKVDVEILVPLTGATDMITENMPQADSLAMKMLQNATSRFTFVTSPTSVTLTVTRSTTVKISSNRLPFRVRVIIEDVDTFHQGSSTHSNYFGLTASQDFFSPVELFSVPQ